MANDYAAMVSRIADEIDDTDLASQTKLAILDAIKRYRGNRFWFNSIVNATFAVAAAGEYVAPALAVAGISVTEPLNAIDLLTIDDGAGANYRDVTPVDNSYIDSAQIGSITGRPRYYAQVADSAGTRLRFFPTPDQAYTAKATGIIRYADPVGDADTSPWFVDAETLIRQAAKAILATDVTRDVDGASAAAAAEMRALSDLRKESLRRTPIQPLRTEVAGMQSSMGRYNIMTGTAG